MKRDGKRALREYIRKSLREDWSDYGGVTPWSYGMGGSTKHAKASKGFGTYGNSLYSIFIDPFVQAAKVAGAELGRTGVRVVSLLSMAVETALDALIPGFKANYDKIEQIQKKYLDKIKEKYADAYKAVDDAWDHPDIQFFAFMHDPTTWLTYKAIAAKPEAALSVYDALAEGSQTLTLYLRDIRNRLFGASVPGQGLETGARPMPVRSESRTLASVLREGDVQKTVDFQGLSIDIDRPKGFVQTGTNPEGEEWERTYLYDYGFVKGTEGGDGEDLDVFVGPDESAPEAYVVVQKKADGTFDEYKAFVGFPSEDAALAAYEEHIPVEFFEDVFAVPVGVLKGLTGVDPLEEAGPARPKTAGELLADALTSPQFRQQVAALPLVQQMRKDAEAVEGQSASELKRAMEPVLGARTAEDLASASGGAWQLPPEYAQLGPDERASFDDVVTKQVKAAMANYYSTRLGELLKQAAETGISKESPYALSLRRTIDSLEPVKQAAASGGIPDAQAQGQGRVAPEPAAGRAEGPGKPGGGVRQQAPVRGSGAGRAQGAPQGADRGVQRQAGRQDAQRGDEDREDQELERP